MPRIRQPKTRQASAECTGCPHLRHSPHGTADEPQGVYSCGSPLSADMSRCPYPDHTLAQMRDGGSEGPPTSVTCPMQGIAGMQCRKDCAWLLRVQSPSEHERRHACAMAVLASHLSSNRHDIDSVRARFFEFKEQRDG